MATFLADQVIVFDAQPSVDARANSPESLLTGCTKFLENLDVTSRCNPNSFHPRIEPFCCFYKGFVDIDSAGGTPIVRRNGFIGDAPPKKEWTGSAVARLVIACVALFFGPLVTFLYLRSGERDNAVRDGNRSADMEDRAAENAARDERWELEGR